MDINRKLPTIHPKFKEIILNLFSRTGNHMNTICDLSTPLPLGVILLAININRNLVTIHPKLKGMILSLFLKTGNDYSLAVNSMEFLYQLVYLRFTCYKLKIIDILQFLTSEVSRTNSSRF